MKASSSFLLLYYVLTIPLFTIEVIEKRQPDLVFLYRFEKQFLQSPKLKDYLEKNYIQFPDKEEKGTLFISPKTWQEYQSKAN